MAGLNNSIKFLFVILFVLLSVQAASADSVYYPAKGNNNGTFISYTNPVICNGAGGTTPCSQYNGGTFKVYMDRSSVQYMVLNAVGDWRWIRYNISNPTSLIPTVVSNPKSLVWMNMYPNNTNLRYVLQSHGIKLNIWGNDTPPSEYFNFTYTLSTGIDFRKQGEEILFVDTVTGEPLWIINYPTMQVNGTDVNLDFRKDGNKISIHAPDLFDSNYNFSGGWELDPSTQSGSTIYISDRQNLTQVSIDINNASALQDLGGGEWLLNAYLINNNTANTFYMNSSDVTWLKINSTYSWYYLTNSITEINDTKITSWSTSTNVVLTTGNRGYVLADGASSFLNITNSNLSYLGSSATNKFGVTYANNSNSNVSNSYFIRNTRGINLVNSNNSIFNNNTFFGSVSGGVDLTSSNNNTFTNNLMQGEGGSGSGMVLVSSNYNNFSNNNMTTNSGSTGRGLDYGSSSSNTFLSNQISSSGANAALYSNAATVSNSNTFENNTIFTTSGGTVSITNIFNNSFKNGSIYKPDGGNSVYVLLIDDTNIFVNTNFTSYRRINFNNNLSYFNYSNNSGTTFVNTNLSASKTLRRNINNWTLTNISLEENITSGTVTSYYNITGLNPNVEYQIYNDTNIDFNLTTDSNGQLPLFFINLNTTVKSIKVLQVASEGATTYNVSGYVNDSLGASLESVSVVNGTNFTTTNATGYYNLTMGNGTYNFTYSKSGYVTGYKDITISGDDVFNQNMTLAPEATEAQFTHTIFGAWE